MTRSRLLALVVLAIVATALPAKACSCAIGDPRDALEASDGAFIGTLVSQAPDPSNPDYSSIYTFSVQETFKGDFGDTVEVYSASNGAACGLEVPVGGETGLFLYLADGRWNSNLCQQIAPDDLRKAAEPLPGPDGEGPIAMLVSGSYGDAGILSLDTRGRTLAYGQREPDSGLLKVCPGSRRFLEIFGHYTEPRLALRDTATLEVIREVDLPLVTSYRNLNPVAMTCADPRGEVVYLAALGLEDDVDFVFRITNTKVERIYRGKVGDFSFHGTDLYLTEGGRARFLVKLDLADPERVALATVPNRSIQPRVSPNGRWVALLAGEGPWKLVVANAQTGHIRSTELGRGDFGEALWLNNRRIVLLPGGGDSNRIDIYSRALERLRQLDGPWYTRSNFIEDGVAYGVGWGVLYKAKLPAGPAQVLRRFDSPAIYYVAPVRNEVFATR